MGGICYHVLSRGNGRAPVLHKTQDYAAFIRLIIDGTARLPMQVPAHCLMPNQFHLVLRPPEDGELSRWMPDRWSGFAAGCRR